MGVCDGGGDDGRGMGGRGDTVWFGKGCGAVVGKGRGEGCGLACALTSRLHTQGHAKGHQSGEPARRKG